MKSIKQYGLVVMLSAIFSSMAFAELTDQILSEIKSGDRKIRDEITSLKQVPVPEPSNLYQFVRNKQKAIELGKALFWDMQLGSDGVQACASCHFNAGADSRAKNQFSPGLNVSHQNAKSNADHTFATGKGPNYHLKADDFPIHIKSDPVLFNSTVLRDTNDVISSQGVHYSQVQPKPVLPEYKFETNTSAWIDATVGTFYGEMTDESSQRVPLDFEFSFYGDSYSNVTISSNGYLTFNQLNWVSGGTATNRNIPNARYQNNIIAPFWDDFDPGFVRGVYVLAEGTAPNRRLTVTWYQLFHYDDLYDDSITNDHATFQATLYEGSNDIVFRYLDVDMGNLNLSFGASATVGVEYKDGSLGTQYSFNEPVIENGMAIRFFSEPVPPTPIASQSDPDGFQVNGLDTRRVEPRNTPTVINAVFNHRQFWDGRASNTFNGVNGFGDNDPYAFVYEFDYMSSIYPIRVSLDNASLASQAVGPPTSSLEMSTDGRTWVEIGDQFIHGGAELPRETCRRMNHLRPLAKQLVHPDDSVLGALSAWPEPGLKVTSYETMIKQAFHSQWWGGYEQVVHINADGSRTTKFANGQPLDENTFTHIEMNFSLFFGIAIQLYEATLVSDDSPVDRFLDGDKNALTESEKVGFFIADGEGRCNNCHGRGEFTYAAVSRVNIKGLTRVRRGDLIDEGFNNIGVRPTLDDLGVGGTSPFGPLSFGRLTQRGLFDNDKIPNVKQDPDDILESEANLGADGAFKIPTLRNVELTAPYFHNGGESTLEDVVDFYFRGGNFRTFGTKEDDPGNHPHPVIGFDAERENPVEITGLGILRGPLANSGPGAEEGHDGLDDIDRANLVAFLKALTDERVRYRKAPFDHPQLFIPNGHPGDQNNVTDDGEGNATDELLEIPAVGANGGAPLPTFTDSLQP